MRSGSRRFPPGAYTVAVTLQGFRSVKKENVRVGLGQALSIPFRMELPSVAAETVVTAEAPLVSVVSNNVSSNLTSEFILRQPVSRNQTSIVNITPGVKDGLAYGGTQSATNAYSLDGVNVSDPASGEQWILPNVDWLKEVQVSGLGADAEIGGFTGAAINLVTKSGGNTLSGDVTAYYSGGDLNSENSSDPDLIPAKVDSETDFAANVGGALKKDLLWFFVSGNEVRSEVQRQGAQNTDVRKYSRYLGKLTLQLNEANKLVGLLDYDGVTHDRRGISLYTYESASTRQESPNWSYNLSWESMLSSSSFLELKATGFTGADDRLPYGGPDTPGRADAESGIAWQNATYTNFVDNSRLSLDGAWSLFADGLIAKSDSHRFKIGISYERAEGRRDPDAQRRLHVLRRQLLLRQLRGLPREPRRAALYSSDRGNDINLQSVNKGLSAYLQDSWQVSRLTVNAGVRYTRYEGGFRNGDESVYAPGNLFSPRIGFVWDVFGTAKTAVKAHYGRYYEGLFTYLYDREESGQVFTPTTYWDYNFDTGAFDIPAGGGSTNRAALDPSIGHPYMDQVVVSVEQQVGRDLSFGVDYARRENSDIVAFANVVDDYDALVAPAGVFTDVNGNQVARGRPPLLRPPLPAQQRPPEPRRRLPSVRRGLPPGREALLERLERPRLRRLVGEPGEHVRRQRLHGASGPTGTARRTPTASSRATRSGRSRSPASVDLPWGILASGYYQFFSGENWTPTVLDPRPLPQRPPDRLPQRARERAAPRPLTSST